MYADESYYTDTFGGSAVPAENLTQALTLAAEVVDELTHYRISAAGLTTFTAFQQIQIQKACCIIAEDAYAGGCLSAGGTVTGGFSLGDFTISAPTGQRVVAGVSVSERALSVLRSSGQMYAGGVGSREVPFV